jgi:hypothetical protein
MVKQINSLEKHAHEKDVDFGTGGTSGSRLAFSATAATFKIGDADFGIAGQVRLNAGYQLGQGRCSTGVSDSETDFALKHPQFPAERLVQVRQRHRLHRDGFQRGQCAGDAARLPDLCTWRRQQY